MRRNADGSDAMPAFSYTSVNKPSKLGTPSDSGVTPNSATGGVSSFSASQASQSVDRVRHGRFQSSPAVPYAVTATRASLGAAVMPKSSVASTGRAGPAGRDRLGLSASSGSLGTTSKGVASALVAPRAKKFTYKPPATPRSRSRSSEGSTTMKSVGEKTPAEQRGTPKRWVVLDENDDDAIDALMQEMDQLEAKGLSQASASNASKVVCSGEPSPAPAQAVGVRNKAGIDAEQELSYREAEVKQLRELLKLREETEVALKKELLEKKNALAKQKKATEELVESSLQQLKTKLEFKEVELRDSGNKLDFLDQQLKEEKERANALMERVRAAEAKANAAALAVKKSESEGKKANGGKTALKTSSEEELWSPRGRRGRERENEGKEREKRQKLEVWRVRENSTSYLSDGSKGSFIVRALARDDGGILALLHSLGGTVASRDVMHKVEMLAKCSQVISNSCVSLSQSFSQCSAVSLSRRNGRGGAVGRPANRRATTAVEPQDSYVLVSTGTEIPVFQELSSLLSAIAQETLPCRALLPCLQDIIVAGQGTAVLHALEVVRAMAEACHDCRTALLGPLPSLEESEEEHPSEDIFAHPSFASSRICTTFAPDYGTPEQTGGKRVARQEVWTKRRKLFPSASPAVYILVHLQQHLLDHLRRPDLLFESISILHLLSWSCPLPFLAPKFSSLLTDGSLAVVLAKSSTRVQEIGLELTLRLLHSEKLVELLQVHRPDTSKSLFSVLLSLLVKPLPFSVGHWVVSILSMVATRHDRGVASLAADDVQDVLLSGLAVLLDRATSSLPERGGQLAAAVLQLMLLLFSKANCTIHSRRHLLLSTLSRLEAMTGALAEQARQLALLV